MLCYFSELCKDAGTKPCAVTVLTPKRQRAVQAEYGKSRMEVVMDYAKLSFDCGCMDVVCSSEESLSVHEINEALGINTPAIRLPKSSHDDQSNVNTPYAAFKNCATRLVIGRDISRGNDFYGNLAQIWANIEGGSN
jgi:orotidine-5'-phosphate decarboxylase